MKLECRSKSGVVRLSCACNNPETVIKLLSSFLKTIFGFMSKIRT